MLLTQKLHKTTVLCKCNEGGMLISFRKVSITIYKLYTINI